MFGECKQIEITMFAGLFGKPDNSASPLDSIPLERARTFDALVDAVIEPGSTELIDYDRMWESEDEPVAIRVQDSSGNWESYDAEVERRNDHEAVVITPGGAQRGDAVWIEDEDCAYVYVVTNAVSFMESWRLELRATHVERRNVTRRDDECLGKLEVLTGDEDRPRTVTVNNVSGGGAQIETKDPLPDFAPVRLTFRDRDMTGAVRYCRAYEGVYVAGVQFALEIPAA